MTQLRSQRVQQIAQSSSEAGPAVATVSMHREVEHVHIVWLVSVICHKSLLHPATWHNVLQVKALFRNPRIIGRNFPICQLEVSGLKLEISSMHTRPPRTWQQAAASTAAAAAGVPADVAEHCLGTGSSVGAQLLSSVENLFVVICFQSHHHRVAARLQHA
jgi:hypothetical protein